MAPSDTHVHHPRDPANRAADVAAMPEVRARLPMPRSAVARGISPAQWRVLVETTFPSAKSPEAVEMAFDYCKVRGLDVFKKPVHIVPMWSSAKNGYVETVWPGINEIQITAARTGAWAGMDPPRWGPPVTRTFTGSRKVKDRWEQASVELTFPEWCEVTVYRIVAGQPRAFCEPVYWLEAYSTSGGKNSELPTDMWVKRPRGQIQKVAKAASLRAAFPEEGEYTAEEMEGKEIEVGGTVVAAVPAAPPVTAPLVEAPSRWTRDAVDQFERDLTERLAAATDLDGLDKLWRDGANASIREIGGVDKEAQQRLISRFSRKKNEILHAQERAGAEAGEGAGDPGDDPEPLPERPRTVEVPVADDGSFAWGMFFDRMLDVAARVPSRAWGEAFLAMHKVQLGQLGQVRDEIGTYGGKPLTGVTAAARIRGALANRMDAVDPPHAPAQAAE